MKVALAVFIFVVLHSCCVYSQLNVGDACLLINETPGICKPRSACSDQIKKTRLCGYQKGVRIICCASPVTVPSEIPQVDNTTVISPGSGLISNRETTLNILETHGSVGNPPDGNKATAATLDESAAFDVSVSPPTTIQKNSEVSPVIEKSRSKCFLYSKEGFEFQRFKLAGEIRILKVPRCSANSKKAVDGQKALLKEFPHMAALGYGERMAITWECEGSLISERFVLTAAHCIGNNENRVPKWVRLGDLNLVATDDEAEPETIQVEAIVMHPEYRRNEYYNDIALVKMRRNVVFTAFIRPACLNTISYDFPNMKVIASGWGKIFSSPLQGTNDMMKVQLKVGSPDTCADIYRSRLQSGNTSHMICAEGTQTGPCQGGSGGPIQMKLQDCMFSILGVSSFGNTGCGTGNNSAVYTRVASFLPWIEETVWP